MKDESVDVKSVLGDLGQPISPYFVLEAISEYSKDDHERLCDALEDLDTKPGIKAFREVLQIISQKEQSG